MYYTPAVVIPGKLAHITLAMAQSMAKSAGTYVMDDNFKIIKDYRKDAKPQ
jgi:hypothetical protein